MRAIVCGAGMVGSNIARQLAAEENDVVVIDSSPDLVRKITDTLDVQGVVGFASHPDVLDRAGARDAELIVAVTHSDEVNMIACQVCHSLFNVPVKIARVRSQSYLKAMWRDLFSRDNLPIDEIISPEMEVAKSVLRRLNAPGAFETLPFLDGKVQVVGVRLDDDCPVVNTPLRQLTELFPDLDARVIGIWREDAMRVPKADDQLFPGDEIYFCSRSAMVPRTLAVFGHEEQVARRIIIMGGGNVGLAVAEAIEQEGGHIRARLIEDNKSRAEFVADHLSRTVVLHGDALDREVLEEAGVADAETVVALTNDDEVNILASVLAKRQGARRAVTLINNENYRSLMRTLNIDTFINPRATTVSKILQHVRRGRIKALRSVQDGAAEVIEAEALETSPLTGKPLEEVSLPTGIIVAGVLQDGQVIIPRGDTVIKPGARVVLFATADMVRKVEQMFRVSFEYF
ncbi:MAG: Trk system potassium transporter TrkA [Alphaproteobacteria bacterium]|nr:Trk system potassium transporter TrkA [Alphaproteobacteria bacterium]MDX5370281.1 Trk system potassium transporter TrkA [Alphaproteobacteria bacterium]MDX5464823.1 Trk system potassium transporter TrkA [Alphaproteobacteria bacterium]